MRGTEPLCAKLGAGETQPLKPKNGSGRLPEYCALVLRGVSLGMGTWPLPTAQVVLVGWVRV